MKLYEVKALAHETQSRIRQDLNAWNDFLEHASRVYRYRFMDQILIYAQLDADRKETPQNAPQNKQAQRNDIKEKYIKI